MVLKGTLFSGLIATRLADLNLLYVDTPLLNSDISRLESRKGRSRVQLNIYIINMSKACHNSDAALIVDDTEIHLSSQVLGEAEYDLRSLITVLFVTRKRR